MQMHAILQVCVQGHHIYLKVVRNNGEASGIELTYVWLSFLLAVIPVGASSSVQDYLSPIIEPFSSQVMRI